jgi:DNA-binding GntR family transcriptional regulator
LRDDTIHRVSLVDNVTQRLRASLLTGEIKPGEAIRVTALEKRFGVSHIPIREALRRLEAEGFVIALPQRAAVAAGVDLEDLNGLYDLRKIIECEVAGRAAEVAGPASVARARAALVELEATGDTSQAEFWDRHRDFHWAVIEQGANPWVKRVLDQLWLASERYVRLFHAVTFEDAMRDHRQLVDLLEARDAVGIQKLLRTHLERTETAVRAGLVGSSDEPATGIDEPAA